MNADLDECIHGLGPVSACVICNGRADQERAAGRAERNIFPARYEGRCRSCHGDIDVGDLISWAADTDGVTHAECSEQTL